MVVLVRVAAHSAVEAVVALLGLPVVAEVAAWVVADLAGAEVVVEAAAAAAEAAAADANHA